MRGRHWKLTSSRARRSQIVCAAGALLLLAPVASAQTPEAKEITYARELGRDGLDLYEKGDYAKASEKLERAYRLYQVPTLGLWSARALEKIRKLRDAERRYRETAALALKPTDPPVFQTSQADAKKAGDVLAPRIPVLTIKVVGATATTARVTVDGKFVPADWLGRGIRLDPGTHAVEARRGDERVAQETTLAESEQRTVKLVFPAAAQVPVTAAPAETLTAQTSPTANVSAASDATASDDGAGMRTLGWVLASVGGAGLVAGTVFAVLAAGTQSDLEDKCMGSECPRPYWDDVDKLDHQKLGWQIAFPVGAAFTAAGIWLVLANASETPTAAVRVQPWLGVNSAGLHGSF